METGDEGRGPGVEAIVVDNYDFSRGVAYQRSGKRRGGDDFCEVDC